MNELLIVEDDKDLREGLAFALEMDGYVTAEAASKREALSRLREKRWDLVLLDCNLPDGNGFDLLQEWRSFCDTPVFMLTARNTEMDEVKALSLGVADYMSKPFSLAVLKARIRRILQTVQPSAMVTSGEITIDKNAAQVYRGGEMVDLSRIEYRLLCYLMEKPGQILTKAQILAHVWDVQGKFVDENTLSVTIRRLRAKIERDPKQPQLIRTVHGIGYTWKETPVMEERGKGEGAS